MPEVAETIASPFGHGELKLGERWRLASTLTRRGYDQAVVLPNSFKSALVARLAAIPVRTGYVGEFRYPLLNDARSLDERAHPLLAEQYAALADLAGSALVRPLPSLRLTVSETARTALLDRLA